MKVFKVFAIAVMFAVVTISLFGCSYVGQDANIQNTYTAVDAAFKIIENQPAPTDIEYSLERYNVIRRAYWVNGQREKANSLPCEIERPLGYVALFSENGSVIGKFVVDGKVSSLNSYLFPAFLDVTSSGFGATTKYDAGRTTTDGSVFSVEIPGIDGGYGSNAGGVFFFTIDGKYVEWTGQYLYSDIPFEISDPVLKYEEVG